MTGHTDTMIRDTLLPIGSSGIVSWANFPLQTGCPAIDANFPTNGMMRVERPPARFAGLARVHSGWTWHVRIARLLHEKNVFPDGLRDLQATQPVGTLRGLERPKWA